MTLDWDVVGDRRGYWRWGRAGKDPGSWKLRQVVLFHFFFFLWFYDCKLAVAGQLWLYLLEADVHVNLRFLRLKTIESGTMKYGRGKWKFCQLNLYKSPDFCKLFTELVSEIGTSFYNWNILGFRSLDLGCKFSLICHSLSPLLLKFLESKETLVKAKQSEL